MLSATTCTAPIELAKVTCPAAPTFTMTRFATVVPAAEFKFEKHDQGVRVLPESPLGGLGVTQATSNSFPIAVTPLLGAALAAGDGEAAWLAIAAFVFIGGLLNLRPAVPPTSARPG